MLLPPAGGLLKRNRGKIGCLILVFLQVVSAPARFWEHGARCFVGRLCVRGLEEAATFLGISMTSGRNYLAGEVQANHAVRIAVYCCFSAAIDLKGHAVENGSRQSERWDEKMSGSVMERRARGIRNVVERLVASAIWS